MTEKLDTHREFDDGVAFCGDRPDPRLLIGVWGDDRFPITCAPCLIEGERSGCWPYDEQKQKEHENA